jgi:hypothetical protein
LNDEVKIFSFLLPLEIETEIVSTDENESNINILFRKGKVIHYIKEQHKYN